MSLSTLVAKLRSKKHIEQRSAFSHYVALVKDLAAGKECDADEAGAILESVSKTESNLEADVAKQQQRFEWAEALRRHQQSAVDQQAAERELAAAQAALDEAVRRLQPAVDAALAKYKLAEHTSLITSGMEHRLADPDNLVDKELLARESELREEMKVLSQELNPLLLDRGHLRDSKIGRETFIQSLRGRPKDSLLWGLTEHFNKDVRIRDAERDLANIESKLAQLDEAIRPRVEQQQRLQNELNQIHQRKLEP